jgi:hypothetical protein
MVWGRPGPSLLSAPERRVGALSSGGELDLLLMRNRAGNGWTEVPCGRVVAHDSGSRGATLAT